VTTRGSGGPVEVDYEALNRSKENAREPGRLKRQAQRGRNRQKGKRAAEPTLPTSKRLDAGELSEESRRLIVKQSEEKHIQKLWGIASGEGMIELIHKVLQDAIDLFKRNGAILKCTRTKSKENSGTNHCITG